jgi:hypothetical protein
MPLIVPLQTSIILTIKYKHSIASYLLQVVSEPSDP